MVRAARQRRVHDHRDAGEAAVGLDLAGEHEAIHLGHLDVGQHQAAKIGDLATIGLGARRDPGEFLPGLAAVDRADVAQAHGIQGLGDLLARHRGVVGEIHHVGIGTRQRRDVAEQEGVVVARGLGEHALDVEHHHQAAVGERSHRGHQPAQARGEHLGRHPHLRPVQAQDGVDTLDQEALGVAVVLGDDHDLARSIVTDPDVAAEIDHRDERAAQAHHALHRVGHVGRGGDGRPAHHLAHLEDVDAVSLAAAAARVHAEREQQDLELVGAGEPGAGVDVLQQFGHGCSLGFNWAPGQSPGFPSYRPDCARLEHRPAAAWRRAPAGCASPPRPHG